MAIVRTLRAFGGFLCGIVFGSILTYSCFVTLHSTKSPLKWTFLQDNKNNSSKNSFSHLQVAPREDDMSSSEEVTWPVQETTTNRKNEDDTEATRLKNKVRVLCWVMTSPENIALRAVHVSATWGRHCNILLFMSSTAKEPVDKNLLLPIVELNVPEGRDNLYEKTKAAFKYVHKHHFRDADWFLKADDDTFVVVENLRYLLKDKLPSVPAYLGRRFKGYAEQGYMSGGAGYVLSRAALRRFVGALQKQPDLCEDDFYGVEDVLIGMCLEKCGVKAIDTRDDLGRQTFHPLPPCDHLRVDYLPKSFWLYDIDYYPVMMGPDCCSDNTISFHYISANLMHLMEFLVYRMRAFGISRNCDLLEDE